MLWKNVDSSKQWRWRNSMFRRTETSDQASQPQRNANREDYNVDNVVLLKEEQRIMKSDDNYQNENNKNSYQNNGYGYNYSQNDDYMTNHLDDDTVTQHVKNYVVSHSNSNYHSSPDQWTFDMWVWYMAGMVAFGIMFCLSCLFCWIPCCCPKVGRGYVLM
mmetsp:Transcript_3530/g.4684  ORF Transcript_3530/g.4684 Transcript_3530/m.4684 type:complete len:161 (+) Transcript_3530:99-581(+)